MAKLSAKSETFLIQALARHQTPFLPIRSNWEQAAAIHARRRGEAGSGSLHVANRMESSRRREELRQLGFLDNDGRLTQSGKRHARSRTWQFAVSELREAIDRLYLCLANGDYMLHCGQQLIPEQFISGSTDPIHLTWLQNMFLPLLTDGILESRSAVSGWTFYAISDGDLEAHLASFIDNDVLISQDLVDAYRVEKEHCRAVLLGDNEYYSELGELPCPVLPLESGRSHSDLPFGPLFGDSGDG